MRGAPPISARLLCTGLLALVLATAGDAAAASITLPFALALDGGATGSFGTVEIEELAGGDLAFAIALAPALGPSADLQDFSFDLPAGLAAGLAVSNSRCGGASCQTPFALESGAAGRGGAGSDFDFLVSLGDGAGPTGNGALALASFVLGGDAALSLADVLALRPQTASGIELHFAAHVQGTGTGEGSETIGVPAPEPATALVLVLGRCRLAWAGRRFAPGRRARPRGPV